MRASSPAPAGALLGGAAARAAVVFKVLEYAGLALYLLVAPRLMGPEAFGSLAALLALLQLLMMVSGLGALATFGRFAPEYLARGEASRLRVLFTQTVAARTLVGVALALALALTLPALRPQWSGGIALAAAAALVCSAAAASCFQVFYGVNALGRWMFHTAAAKPLLLVLLALLGGFASMRKASLAILLAELAFLVLGVVWARAYFALDRSVLDRESFRRHLGFGLFFFATNVLQMGIWKGGEVAILALARQGTEVAYFNIAISVVAALAALTTQLGMVLVPSAARLHVEGDRARLARWMGQSLKYPTVAAFLFLAVVAGFGEALVVAALGPGYRDVAPSLGVLGLALLPVAFVRAAISLAVAEGRPREGLGVTLVSALVFVVAALVLVPRLGAIGASAAVVLGLLSAGIAAWANGSMVEVARAARLRRTYLVGAVALASMAVARDAPWTVRALVVALFLALTFAARVVTVAEVRGIVAFLRGKGGPAEAPA